MELTQVSPEGVLTGGLFWQQLTPERLNLQMLRIVTVIITPHHVRSLTPVG